MKKTCKDCRMFKTPGYCDVFMEDLSGDHRTCGSFALKVGGSILRLEDLLRRAHKIADKSPPEGGVERKPT